MFEEVTPTSKNKTDTLNMDQYNRTKAEKKKQTNPAEDTTTDSDVEDNGNQPRSRSKTISGPVQSIGRKVGNKNFPNIVKTLGLIHSDAKKIETRNHKETPSNRLNEEFSAKRDLLANEDPNLVYLSDIDDNAYRTSYRNNPFFPNPLRPESTDYRQPSNNNSETNGERSTLKIEDKPNLMSKTAKLYESENIPETSDVQWAAQGNVTSVKEIDDDQTSSVENSSSNQSSQEVLGDDAGEYFFFFFMNVFYVFIRFVHKKNAKLRTQLTIVNFFT